MTQEEKARRYDEALDRAKSEWVSNLDNAYKNYRERLEIIFPELVETEDERIKNKLIKLIKMSSEVGGFALHKWEADEMVAWLEKQSEHNLTDKVEPKFKVGNWIINKYMRLVMQILNNDNGFYKTVDTDGIERNYSYDFMERNFKLWTIQDAKEGDVLANSNISVFIYAEVLYNKPYAYCGVDKFGVFKDNCRKNDWSNSIDNVHPATKEQREQLFKAMHEAGYEWDNKKKELKKIEQNPTDKVEPKFKNGQWLIWQNKCYKVNYNGCGYELIDQNGLSTSLEYGIIDENAHLWTIQDAKDGDVLSFNNHGDCIICKCPTNDETYSYCRYENNCFIYKEKWGWRAESLVPATKEEKEKLFNFMESNGYEWDAEKKEVRKIEQKHAWNEEDERIYQSIIDDTVQENQLDSKQIDWLKLFKERMTNGKEN